MLTWKTESISATKINTYLWGIITHIILKQLYLHTRKKIKIASTWKRVKSLQKCPKYAYFWIFFDILHATTNYSLRNRFFLHSRPQMKPQIRNSARACTTRTAKRKCDCEQQKNWIQPNCRTPLPDFTFRSNGQSATCGSINGEGRGCQCHWSHASLHSFFSNVPHVST